MSKKETISLIDTFSEFKELKNIDRSTLISVMEESFRNVISKMFGTDENYDVIINPDKGDFEIYRNRVVVADGGLHAVALAPDDRQVFLGKTAPFQPFSAKRQVATRFRLALG